MPVTIVVGGQYGSEGKGKVARHVHLDRGATAAVRVGGANSGHTVVASDGKSHVLRQLPVAVTIPNARLFLPAGNYLNLDVLLAEIERYHVTPQRLSIDPDASLITDQDRQEELAQGLTGRIGSTASGTGAAVARRLRRDGAPRAADEPALRPFLRPTAPGLREELEAGRRVIVEGTQGFGLSVLHGGSRDYATSRDTTAAGFLSEAGLSPLDVDEVVMVLRALPIRVAGNSGPLPNEMTWHEVATQSGQPGLTEQTTVTRRTRRVAAFDPDVVRRAIAVNRPTSIVLNHVDYLADLSQPLGWQSAAEAVDRIEDSIGRPIRFVGTRADMLLPRESLNLEPAPSLEHVTRQSR